MAPDTRRAFAGVFREQAGASDADAQAWLAGLVANGRYVEDIWASASNR
jgi:cytochrome P450/NADPH-cytochrome P450 reductase